MTDPQIEEGIALMPLNLHASLRRGIERPDGWPYIRAIHVDERDRIWVVGSSPGLDRPHPLRVLDRNGKPMGRGHVAELPQALRGGAFYYFVKDEEEDLFLEKAVVHF